MDLNGFSSSPLKVISGTRNIREGRFMECVFNLDGTSTRDREGLEDTIKG